MKINRLNSKRIMKNYHKVIEFVIKDSKKYERPNSKTHIPRARAKLITTILLATLVISLPIQMGHSEPDVYFAATYQMGYSKYDSSTDYEVWVSIHRSGGTVTHHQISNSTRHEIEPSIAIAPNGNIIVAWYDSLLSYAILDYLGRPIKLPTPLSSSTRDYIPCVAVTPNSVVFVVYEAEDPSPDQVAYKTMDDDGENVSSEKYIQGIEGEVDYPTIAASIHNPDDTRVIIAWVEYDKSTATSQVFFTILDSAGGTIVPRTKITDTSLRTWNPNAAILPDGKAVIVYEHSVTGGKNIYFAIIDESGLTVESGEISYNTRLRHPAVAATPQNNIVIVWEDTEGLNRIMYMLLDSEGNMITVPTSLSDPATSSLDPDVAVNTLGLGVGIWETYPPAGGEVVNYAFLDSFGNKLNGPRMLTDGTYIAELEGALGTRQIAVRPAHITTPVGGLVTPTNKLAVLSPYIALAGLIVAVSAVYVVKKRKD